MLSQGEFYDMLARSDGGFGILFASSFLLTIFMGRNHRYFHRLIPFKTGKLNLSRMGERFFWITTIATAVGIRIPGMFESFWYDETWSGVIAQLPAEQLPEVILADVHPPLPYLIFWLNDKIFPSFGLFTRIPSLVFGLLSLYLMYRFVIALRLGKHVAMLTVLIVALLPTHIYYSNEARGYSMLVCAVLVGGIAVMENRKRWFIVASTLPLIHAHGYIYLGFLVLGVLWKYRLDRRWFRTLFVSGIAGSAWLPFMIQQSRDVADGFWLAPLTLPGSLWYIVDMTVGQRLNSPVTIILVFVPVMILTIVSLWNARNWLFTGNGFILFLIAVGVPLLTAGISFTWRPVYLLRALLPAALMFVILWSYTLIHWKHPLANLTRLLVLCALLVALASSFLPEFRRMDLGSMLAYCDDADYTLALSSSFGVISLYYSEPDVILWEHANDGNQFISERGKNAFGFTQGNIQHLKGWVCIPYQHNPLTSPRERDYIYYLQHTYQGIHYLIEDDETFTAGVYLLRVERT